MFMGVVLSMSTSLSASETENVLVFNGPAGFYETLSAVDPDNRVVTAQNEWFSPSSANIWVVFVTGQNDVYTLPPIAKKVIDAIEAEPEPLVRVTAKISSNRNIVVQTNHLSKTDRTANFQGCIAAIDISQLVYARDSDISEDVEKYCANY